MRKLKVLFFAADPFSLPGGGRPRLLLDEDVRRVLDMIRRAEYRDAVEVHLRLATRFDDLLQALNEVQPDVVHFSGHGWSEGLFFLDEEGRRPQGVSVELLTKLFRVFRGNIRLVVLNACLTEPQAEAIADVVGCAIGMRGKVSDRAAIAFGGAFYRAVVFGHSIQTAFDQGCLALGLLPPEQRDCPRLAARADVDPAEIVLVTSPTPVVADVPLEKSRRVDTAPRSPWPKRAAVLLAVGGAVAAGAVYIPDRTPACAWDQDGMPHLTAGGPPTWVVNATSGNASDAATDLEIAKAQQRGRNDRDAFAHFKAAAEAGDAEAMGYLGVAYLCGEGTARRTDLALASLYEAARRGDSRGMIARAFAYQHGIGVKHSRHWTRYWYRMAADVGHSKEAMRRLGGFYEDDDKVDSAVIWYRKAIAAGSSDAMVDLGYLHEKGPESFRDPRHARALFDSAVRAGSVRGMLAMGHAWQDGVGGPRDYARGLEWYRKAVAGGSIEAMNSLGVLYERGWGVKQNPDTARYWFRRAKNAGSAIARENLSVMGAH